MLAIRNLVARLWLGATQPVRRYRPKVLDIALARTPTLAWWKGVVWV